MTNEIEELELDLLLEAVFRRYGYDFRDYERSTLRRRLRQRAKDDNLTSLSMLQERLLRDSKCMDAILKDLAIGTTGFFRDPEFYALLREKVIPYLKTFPSIRIWHAGCSSGEEAYSVAMLLDDAGILGKSRLYATDVNDGLIEKARRGTFRTSYLTEGLSNFERQTGGGSDFSDCFTNRGRNVEFQPKIKQRIFFAVHNMVTDSSFQEFQLILCRNVILYFNEKLQTKSHELLYRSLRRLGYLGLGSDESMNNNPRSSCYKEVEPGYKLYRKVG